VDDTHDSEEMLHKDLSHKYTSIITLGMLHLAEYVRRLSACLTVSRITQKVIDDFFTIFVKYVTQTMDQIKEIVPTF